MLASAEPLRADGGVGLAQEAASFEALGKTAADELDADKLVRRSVGNDTLVIPAPA